MDTIKIFIPLTKAEAESLIALAKKERRHPRDQAAQIIADRLREFEVLSKEVESQRERNPN